MKRLILNLYTPESNLVKNVSAKEVLVPSIKGELGILPGHAPLISLLQAGILKYWTEKNSKPEKVAIGWGYLEVTQEEVRILAETAQTKEALDQEKLEREIKNCLKELETTVFDFEKRKNIEKKLKQLEAERELIV